MPKLIGEIVITAFAIVLETFLWFVSDGIPPASGAYPRALIGLAFVLSLVFLCRCLYKLRTQGVQPPQEKPVPGSAVQISVLCVMISTYFLFMERIGYVIITPLFILVCLLYLGMRNKLVLLLTPLIMTSFTYYLFNNVLFVFLPRGILD